MLNVLFFRTSRVKDTSSWSDARCALLSHLSGKSILPAGVMLDVLSFAPLG